MRTPQLKDAIALNRKKLGGLEDKRRRKDEKKTERRLREDAERGLTQ